jgi:predicted Fe-S protein YdhL (DUF1289 family)
MPDADAVESPCVRVCVIDQATGYCCGCYRTLDEISYWTRYTPEERTRLIARLHARRASAPDRGIIG